MTFSPTRRQWLGGLGALAGAAAFGRGLPRALAAEPNADPRFLIVIGATGGASALDAFLAIRASESSQPDTLNCFEDARVQSFDGSPLRAVDLSGDSLGPIPMPFTANQSDFVKRYRADMLAATWTRTSVNHGIGQARAVTGNDAWKGRTLQEAVALRHGAGFALPNVHLLGGTEFTRRGLDATLPPECYGEMVADPRLWPLALDGRRGLANSPSPALVAASRALRERFESAGTFGQRYAASTRLEAWRALRKGPSAALESASLIDALLLLEDSPSTPLSTFGLTSSPDAARLREVFPSLDDDPFEAQAALAFLLLKNRLSVSVTLGPSFNVAVASGLDLNDTSEDLPEGALYNPPLAFDFSHQAHRSSQALMWARIYRIAGKLIDLLRAEEWANGQSLWDRTVLYVATDFGRTKTRPSAAPEFGTGHDLDNGLLVVSPLARGDSLLGGVDPNTGLTHGFDLSTGAPVPGRTMEEREIYAGILQMLRVDTSGSGLPDVRAMRRTA